MRLKWDMNNVVSARGNTLSCIAKFDNCRVWLESSAIMSVQTFKADIREIAKLYGAKSVEVKYLHADDEAGTRRAALHRPGGNLRHWAVCAA